MPGDAPLGYEDTPLLPGGEWRVHDPARPQPRVVTPGDPPSDAVVLFDGSSFEGWEAWEGGRVGWKLGDGWMEVAPGAGDIRTIAEFGDCQLHLEWATPAEVRGSSQGRGNSGVFLMGRYEIQVLDSWQNRTYADGAAGALYGQFPPLVNASRPPGDWQSYDVVLHTGISDGTDIVRPPRLTVLHNGVVVHHARELLGETVHRAVAEFAPHPALGPLRLQDHGDPVRFRNIWVRSL